MLAGGRRGVQTLPVHKLIRRVRQGDAAAAAELVRRYEPELRREVRLRMRSGHLSRLMDSVDVSQSVLCSFFVSVSLGRYEIEQPGQLRRLLVRMARNKLADQLRRHRARRRDLRRHRSLVEADVEGASLARAAPSPSDEVALEELVTQFRSRLTPEERRLADQRRQGRTWAEIAADRQVSAEALRKRLSRAIQRVASELDVDLSHA